MKTTILLWLTLDYALLFASIYLTYTEKLFILRELMLATALTRCQYQHHDFAHGQFDKLQLFNKRITKLWFTLTTGFSTEYWNDVEHMPHHIHVNNFDKDPDDFVAAMSNNYKFLLIFLMPLVSIK